MSCLISYGAHCKNVMPPMSVLGFIVQLVESQTADPGVSSLIQDVGTFVEIDHEIISMVILLLQLIQEGFLSFTSIVHG